MASSRWLHGVRCRFLGKTLPVAVQYRLSTATMHTIFRSSFLSRDGRKPEQKNWENNFYRRENLASACVCVTYWIGWGQPGYCLNRRFQSVRYAGAYSLQNKLSAHIFDATQTFNFYPPTEIEMLPFHFRRCRQTATFSTFVRRRWITHSTCTLLWRRPFLFLTHAKFEHENVGVRPIQIGFSLYFLFVVVFFFYYRYRDLHVNDILSLSNESGRSHPVGKSHLILCFVITSSRLKKLETEQSKNLLLIVNRCQLYLWKKLRIFHISLKIHQCTW